MSRAKTKAERLKEMERLYLQRAYSDINMAKRLGVTRSTAYKYRQELELELPFLKDEQGRWYIDKGQYISEISVNLFEALALYLAARRTSRQSQMAQPHVASGLEKLATALKRPMTERLVKAADQVLSQHHDPQKVKVMETVARAWAEQIKVRIHYQALDAEETKTHVVAPYLVEPSQWSDSTYLIGHTDQGDKIIPFKLDRIQRAMLTTEQFAVPDDFDEETLLRHAWGIWYSERDPVEVVLRFEPGRATRRLKESVWHPNEDVTDAEDGGCIWRVHVDQWQEMVPWIRGWGEDVEVLEPGDLREKIKSSASVMGRKYGLSSSNNNPQGRLLRLWGKTTRDAQIFHPALYHMLDVAHVALQLLSPRATPRWRNVLGETLKVDAATLHEWLPWIVALHDLGKLSVPFQAQNEKQRRRLEEEGFDFGSFSSTAHRLHHTLTGRHVVRDWSKRFPSRWRTIFLDMISGHHGTYQQMESTEKRKWGNLQEPEEWQRMRERAIDFLSHALLQNEPDAWPEPENLSAAIVALNGFTILCDWLGSDENYFAPHPLMPPLAYLSHSRGKARERVADAGLFAPARSEAPTTFSALFGWQPRPLQSAVDEIPARLLHAPTLTIIEAPTGEGKTEAALTLARRIAATRQTDEMYIALPTTATSNAMYTRLQVHLRERLGLSSEMVKLIHGQDFLVEDDLRITPLSNGDDSRHPALSWFSPKKKALLAPFGVGTVDQAELAALNVRHNALRLIGLAGKVVILDEVHAYDTYMTTIIENMLRWLSALGSSVILLSATLPKTRRRQLAEAFAGREIPGSSSDAYPYLLTAGQADHHEASPPAETARRTIHLETLHFAEDDWSGKAEWLVEAVEYGGCACWITNTVERAQRIFQEVVARAPADVKCLLLHARFPLEDRQAIEQGILDRFGKEGRRPVRSIVVGTQVLEQSLDIDFDVMVSDLAPIDLLLQRVGRLHRHRRKDRSPAFPEPIFTVNCELDGDGKLQIGGDRFYTPYILHKSWQEIARRAADAGMLILPHDYRPLVEAVYDESAPEEGSQLYEAWKELRKKEQKYTDEARLRLANPPDPRRPFWKSARLTFREDEDSAEWVVAQTRFQERPSITVIPLERVDDATARLYPAAEIVALDGPADRATQLKLLRRSVRLSHPGVVSSLLESAGERPALFTQSPLLQRIHPLWLVNGTHRAGNTEVEFIPELGIVISKIEGET